MDFCQVLLFADTSRGKIAKRLSHFEAHFSPLEKLKAEHNFWKLGLGQSPSTQFLKNGPRSKSEGKISQKRVQAAQNG